MFYLFRFVVGGLVVCAFASLADVLKAKTFAGIFAAAPSVALATPALPVARGGKTSAADEARSMMAGAADFVLYAFACLQLIARLCWSVFRAALIRLRRGSLVFSAALDAMWIRFDFAALRRTKPKEYAVRFFFGDAGTLLAGFVARQFGPAIGGLVLAFPAIFPAGVTLIATYEERRRQKAGVEGRERGKLAAALDARGAVIGACGLFFSRPRCARFCRRCRRPQCPGLRHWRGLLRPF